jgi:DNA-binding CsgD family transcriptional regulator
MPRQNSNRPDLTRRQAETIRLSILGCSVGDIAAILGVAVYTAKSHKAAAMKLLGTNRADKVTRLAIKYKYTTPDDRLTPEEKRICSRKKVGHNGDAHCLPPLQVQIIRLTSLECSAVDIAATLRIDGGVVERQKVIAQGKLGVDNSPLLTRLAIKLGISSLDDRLSPTEARKTGLVKPRLYSRNLTWVPPLTPRRRQVIRLTSLGCTTRDIAAILGVPESTVVNDRHAIARIIGSGKSTLATRYAISRNISSLDDRLTATEKRKIGRKNDGRN